MHPHAFIRMCLSPLKYYAHLKQVKSSVCPASWHKNKLGIVFFFAIHTLKIHLLQIRFNSRWSNSPHCLSCWPASCLE
jgi:hypothetical protein